VFLCFGDLLWIFGVFSMGVLFFLVFVCVFVYFLFVCV